ncbi:hypothetical protein FRB96_003750 [Tulasnella sp. 330]|nr:hypothetical protein FRB96_003750 [Tulasnella sp. 330]KAG8879797.1 hypothetical protein FRB98_005510 [Tulasnella sp. 332]
MAPTPNDSLHLPRRHKSRIPRSRKEAYRSFENLVVLADDQERWRIARTVGKQLVWRDVGEPPVLLERFRECAEHAGIGGLRAGALAYTARTGVNLFILIFQLARTPKKLRFSVIRHVLFSSSSLHFGAMLGTFVGVYRFILNALPILGLRFKIANERRSHLSQWDALDIQVESDPDDNGAHTPSSPWNSDVESGLYISSKKQPKKSCLKGSSPVLALPQELPSALESTRTTASQSQVSSRSPSPDPSSSMNGKERSPRRIHFNPNLEMTPKLKPRQLQPETADHAIRHPGHLSTRTQAAFALMREKGYTYKRWHAAVAGTVAGAVAILMEQKSNRLAVSQQMFVRGLQGTFNVWSERTGVTVPFGSVWVFAFCCGQIMYGFMLRPDTVPPAYNSWINTAGRIPQDCVVVNRDLMQGEFLNVVAQQRIADGKGKPWNGVGSIITPKNRQFLLDQIASAESGKGVPPFASCSAIHPHYNSCTATGLMRFFEVAKWIAPMYGALHFIPMLVFRRKIFASAPLRMTIKALLGTLRSSAFLGAFVMIYQSFICLLHFAHAMPIHGKIADAIRKLIAGKPMWWIGGFLSGLSLFVEEKKRREELAMYVLPKGLESAFKMVRGNVFGVPTKRKRGWKSDFALSAAGMGMVMSTYQHSPQHLSGLVRRVLYQLVGPN